MTPEQLTGQSQQHIAFIEGNIGLHQQVVAPWQALQAAAAKDGFNLQIVSGFRSFERQLGIFNAKLTGQRPVLDINNCQVAMDSLTVEQQIHSVLLYSALPGASRHHWGTDIDVFDPDLLDGLKLQLEPWEYAGGGPMAPLNDWLNSNIEAFGFYKPYAKYQGGVAPEPWHLSYRPLAAQFEQQLTLDLLRTCLDNHAINACDEIVNLLPSILTRYVKITA
ncbi:D-alanyl-D-alanine carboxypeptidase family protein [Thalassotalea litorea]|uniref:D-alanyl-D-alanine carboxypeptidase family protein n=1 Tax=Thalassotalea litorea TaxID=2020715 RepID=A0A5R9IFB7_9GAMM|nr:M15 family metallopeptidase [Thalassotalea litorea]TLU61310.1 D-alanyl-D-alanine carboxypeptidase family protein [Thalassotalea litorea]